jgi:hypothetical protein
MDCWRYGRASFRPDWTFTDRDVSKADRIAAEARRAALLREENHFAAGRLPSGTTAEQERLVLAAIAGEIVATDPPA